MDDMSPVTAPDPHGLFNGSRERHVDRWFAPARGDILDIQNICSVYVVFSRQEDRFVTTNDLPEQSQNPVKDPEEWTTGGEPMTGPQASYLQTLLQQAGKQESDLDPNLTKAQASEMIDQLQQETGRGTPKQS